MGCIEIGVIPLCNLYYTGLTVTWDVLKYTVITLNRRTIYSLTVTYDVEMLFVGAFIFLQKIIF